MREDKRDRFVEELLDAALASHHSAEPRAGLEERVLANLRQHTRTARSISWNSASALIAVAAVLALFAVEHMVNHGAAPDLTVAVSNEPRAIVKQNPTARLTKAAVVSSPTKRVKAATKSMPSSSSRRDLALNLDSRRENERTSDGLRIEEVRIAEVRLDDIVISNNERRE